MFRDRWALVTGAARGIGRATADLLAARGARLILCDIDRAEIDAVGRELTAAGTTVFTYGVDVGDRQAMQEFAAWAHELAGPLDLLVNNAGVLVLGDLEETSWQEWEHVLSVNLWGVLHTSRLFVPAMRESGRGRVVNVASAAGVVGFSPLLAYTTTKFAVVGFSQALRAELAPHGVGVSVICPGLVNTSIAAGPRFDEPTRERLGELLARRGLSPARVAEAIVRAAETNSALVPVGAQALGLHWAGRLFPSAASALLHRVARTKPSGS